MQRRLTTTVPLVLAAALGAVALSACSGGSSTPAAHGSLMGTSTASPMMGGASSPAADHNTADVMFARMMIPHHQQAIAMAKLAATRSDSDRVKALALTIAAAQGPEITTMSGWLDTWGAGMMAPSPSASGMMSSTDLHTLTRLSGTAFDQAFLTMMIAHHRGAIQIARTEKPRAGTRPPPGWPRRSSPARAPKSSR